MIKIYTLLLILSCLILFGCYSVERPIGKITVLGHKEFGTSEFENMTSVFKTSDTEWLMLFTDTIYVNGTMYDLRPNMNVAYDAYNFTWIQDNQGFSHFCYFVDKIIILE